MKKMWYVGSDSVFRHKFSAASYRNGVWAKETLAEAIEHARAILAAEPDKSEVFIVEVVKVVKRPKIAIEVEDVL